MFKKLLALLIIVVISILSVYSLQVSFNWINHSHEVIYQVHVINNDIFDCQTSIREGVFGNDPIYFKVYLAKISYIDSELDNLEWITKDNPKQQQNIYMLRKNIDRRSNNFRLSYEYFKKGNLSDAQYYLKIGFGEDGTITTRNLVEVVEQEELRLLDIRLKKYQQKYNIVLCSMSLFIILYLVLFNIKEVRKS